jgi:hypothetical protein
MAGFQPRARHDFTVTCSSTCANGVKMLKRQMLGRTGFQLLRKQVLLP